MATTLSIQEFSEYIFDHVIPPELMEKIKSKTPLTESEIERLLPMLQLIGNVLIAHSLDLLEKALTSKAEKTDIRSAKRMILNKLHGEENRKLDIRSPQARRLIDLAVDLYVRRSVIEKCQVSKRQCFFSVWKRQNGNNVYEVYEQFDNAVRYDLKNYYDLNALIARVKSQLT